VAKLSLVNDDPEQGTQLYGVASDCLETPSITIGAGTGIAPYTVSGVGPPTVPGLQAALGGVLRIQTTATANDNAILRLGNGLATNPGPFKYSATKGLWFGCRVAVQDITAEECMVGLVTNDYNPADMATLPDDGLFFNKTAAGTDFTFHARDGGVSTSVAAGLTLVNDTFVELAFQVKDGGVSVYVNGAKKSTTILASDANLPPTTQALSLFIGCQTNAAATKYMDIDHFLCAAER
jgi:hypothetical protein